MSDLADAIVLLEAAQDELADIHRGTDYGLWRQERAPRLGDALAAVAPFRDVSAVWIYCGDGACVTATPRFGEWAIDRLVEKRSPTEILAAFTAEVARNVGPYHDISPVFGLQIDAPCLLEDGVELVPPSERGFGSPLQRAVFRDMMIPPDTALLYQSYRVTPAFQIRDPGATSLADISATVPSGDERERIRDRCRLAGLLASIGPIALPTTVLQPDPGALLVAGEGSGMARPFALHPLVSYPVEGQRLRPIYDRLGRFREIDSLARSIDRLGRARLATSPVDRALDLGIAAEIALMHDHSCHRSCNSPQKWALKIP